MKLKLFIAALMLSIGTAWAQQDSSRNKQINALDYLLQDRYAPERRKIDRGNWRSNSSISTFGGFSHLILGSPVSRNSVDFGLSYTRDWSALHSARISASFQLANKNTNKTTGTQRRYGMEIDDVFHFVDYLWGYNPGRPFDVHTVMGLGVYATDPVHGKTRFSAGAHAGIHLSRIVYKRIGLFIEPRAHIFTDGYDAITGIESSRKYHTGIQILAGSTYFFNRHNIPSTFTDDMYFEIYGGIQSDYSSRADTWFDNHSGRFGSEFGVSVGKWYLPFGYRCTLFGGNQPMPNEAYTEKTQHIMNGLRAEGMVNFNNLVCPYIVDPWMEFNGGVGYEVTALGHYGDAILKSPFVFAHGLTASTQLLVRLTDKYGVFLQGRYSNLHYTDKFTNGTSQKREKHNFGLQLGMQYRSNRKESRHYNRSFRPYNFVTASGGINSSLIAQNSKTLSSLLDFGRARRQFTLGLGRKLTPYSSVRGIIEMGLLGIGKHDKAHPLTLGADYLLDLTSLITHYDRERLFTLSPLIGVLYTHHERGSSEDNKKETDCSGNYLGLRVGFNEHFRLNDQWGIFMEENLRVYKGKYNPKAPTFTHKDLSMLMEINIGVSYKF